MGRFGILFKVSEEFFPLCLTPLLRKLADLGACFKVLSAVFCYRPSEVVSSLNGGPELWRLPWFGVSADFGFADVCRQHQQNLANSRPLCSIERVGG